LVNNIVSLPVFYFKIGDFYHTTSNNNMTNEIDAWKVFAWNSFRKKTKKTRYKHTNRPLVEQFGHIAVARELFLDREGKTGNAKLMGSLSNSDSVLVPEIKVL